MNIYSAVFVFIFIPLFISVTVQNVAFRKKSKTMGNRYININQANVYQNMALFPDSWSIHTVPWLSSSMYSTHSLPAMTAQSLLFFPSLPSSSTLRIKITSTVVEGYQGTGLEMSGQKGFVPLGTGRESSLPLATLHFLNCLAAQACSYGANRRSFPRECVTASCDRGTETARCWTLAPANMDYVKGWPQDWCGYANASQMGGVWAGWTAGDPPPPPPGMAGRTLFGRSIIPSLKATLLLTTRLAWQSAE